MKSKPRDAVERENRENERIMARWTRRVGKLTIVLAMIAFFSALVAALQTFAFMESERASLAPTAIEAIPDPMKVGEPVTLKISFQNGGKSTAVVTFTNLTTRMLEELPAGKPEYQVNATSPHAVIVSGQISALSFTPRNTVGPVLVTQNDLDTLKDGTSHLFLYGFVRYRDDYSFLLGEKTLGMCFIYRNGATGAASTFEGCSDPNYVYEH